MSAWTLPRSRAIRKIRSIRSIRVPQSEEAHHAGLSAFAQIERTLPGRQKKSCNQVFTL